MSIFSDIKGKDCGFMPRRTLDTSYMKNLNNLGLVYDV